MLFAYYFQILCRSCAGFVEEIVDLQVCLVLHVHRVVLFSQGLNTRYFGIEWVIVLRLPLASLT